jgi:predicted metalloprotease with PDZ domain
MQMRRIGYLLAIMSMLVAVTPTMAGSESKCTMETQKCLDLMYEKLSKRGWVGIEYEYVEDSRFMEIKKVENGSPAEEAGLKVGDIITGINGVKLCESNEKKLKEATKVWTPGTTIGYMLKRDGYGMNVKIKLGALPREVLARWIGDHMIEHATPVAAKN